MGYVYHPQARGEYLQAYVGYSSQSSQTADRFEVVVDATVADIVANPMRFPANDPPYRSALVAGFPYTLVYKLESNLVHIVGVIHTSRGGTPWRGRV